jgi:hypothetical protein
MKYVLLRMHNPSVKSKYLNYSSSITENYTIVPCYAKATAYRHLTWHDEMNGNNELFLKREKRTLGQGTFSPLRFNNYFSFQEIDINALNGTNTAYINR